MIEIILSAKDKGFHEMTLRENKRLRDIEIGNTLNLLSG